MALIDVYTELKNNLLSVRQDLVLNPGSAIVDIFLGPTAFIINKNRILLEYRTRLQTLPGIEDLLEDEVFIQSVGEVENETESQIRDNISGFIDQFGGNYGLTRRIAITAEGIAYFGRFDPPTSDITISAGTQIKTLDEKYYETIGDDVIMTMSGSWYDPDLNLHIIPAPIRALGQGEEGNTASSTINILITQVAGIQFVTNKVGLTNGQDEETDTEFIARIKERLMGTNFATKSGLRNLIIDNFSTVKDVYVVGANDSLMTRDDGYGGKTDIYVLEESVSTFAEDTYTAFTALGPAGQNGVILFLQPVDQSSFAEWFVNTIAITLTDWLLSFDLTTALAQSSFAQSFVYSPTAVAPPVVKYKRFKIIEDIYNFLLQDEYFIAWGITGEDNPVDATILVKKANQKDLNIEFTISIVPGYDLTNTKALVTTAINNYTAGLLLGDKIAQSDVIAIAEAIEGVDFIDFTAVGSVFDLDGSGLEVVVEPATNEYIRLGTLVINP